MTIHTKTKRVPDHLVGTRAGLFHVLRGTSQLPADDPMAKADVPSAAKLDETAWTSEAVLTSPVFLKSERDRLRAFLNKDEFCFDF